MKYILFSSILLVFSMQATAQNFTPASFLGYEIGTQFTRQDKVVSYFNALQSAFPTMMKVEKYGETYEHRDLILAFIGTPENLKKLEEIRLDHIQHAPDEKMAIVWLSYNVHGNESSGTEAAMETAFRLLTDKADFLKNTVVIMDPCLNPDGRDRYVNFYNQYGNAPADVMKYSAEHKEPWPSGRPNHYLFDLNRDWAWMTQIESEQRVKRYNQWLPHVHVDFHEQGINEPYYFPPAAEPYHEVITNWQRDFQKEIGGSHAAYFDKQGWLYFSKEIFDLLYPSYGDTYPTYSGSIGMTYEQGGSGRAGLSVITQVGDTLRLKDRVAHHVTTGLSTVEMSAKNADKLVKEYQSFCAKKNYKYQTYVLRGSQAKLEPLMTLMQKNGIEVEMVSTSTQELSVKGFHYQNGLNETLKLKMGDLLIHTQQEKGTLVNVLFEPKTKLSDSLTYDITAWTLPFAYGVEAWACEGSTGKGTKFSGWPTSVKNVAPTAPCYAYLAPWESMKSARFLSDLQAAGITVYFNEKGFTNNKQVYAPGTLIMLRGENKRVDFDQIVTKIANENAVNLSVVSSGFMQEGIDMGSSSVKKIEKASIGIVMGEEASSLNVGELWHFFERQMGRSIHMVFAEDLEEALDQLTVLFVPEGGLAIADDSEVKDWIQQGGKLIVMGAAVYDFAGKEGYDISRMNPTNDSLKPVAFSKQERDQISNNIIGAIFPCELDATNPLAFGYDTYYTLRQSAEHFDLGSNNVFHLKKEAKAENGFVGYRVKKQQSEASIAGYQSYGAGTIIYFIDNPLFRGFWESGKLMIANAVFFVNQ